jgi:hypothetical protein
MNKKLMGVMLVSVFAIALVSAGLAYYGVFSQTMNVESSIVVSGALVQELGNVYDLETYRGEVVNVTNRAPSERQVIISDDSGVDVEVVYTSTLELSQKNVVFGESPWSLLENGREATVEYTVVGDEFTAEVVNGEIKGYALYYYADNDNRFANPNTAVPISEVSGNLPIVGDENAALNDYSEEYPTTPHGAKIWYMPTDAVSETGEVTWSRADEFLFETALIQYNANGELTVYPGQTLELTPSYTPSQYVEGPVTVTTEIL